MKPVNLKMSLEDLAARSGWKPGEWESLIADGHWKGHDHLHIAFFKVPEGLLTAASCIACGGYLERITGPGEMSPSDAVGLAVQDFSTLMPRLDSWARQHSACQTDPKSHRLPEDLLETTDRVLELTREDLAAGTPTHPWCVLGRENGESIAGNVPLAGIDPYEKPFLLAGWHTAIRNGLEEVIGRPTYAVLVTESWMGAPGEEVRPSESPNRREIVQVEQITRRVRRVGVASIRRHGGTPDEGPGEMGELRWYPARWSRLSLGLLAPVNRQDDEKRARQRLGLRF